MALRLGLSVLVATAFFGNVFSIPQYRFIRSAIKSPAPQQVADAKSVISPVAPTVKEDKLASIVAQTYDMNPVDNSYSYSYQVDNGISASARGYMKENNKLVIEGSYTLYTKEGYPVSISYVADENGFNAVGDAIPTADPNIVRAVEYLKSLPPQDEEKA